jgi:hypothetical protein
MERRYLARSDGSENNNSHREYGNFKVQPEEERGRRRTEKDCKVY